MWWTRLRRQGADLRISELLLLPALIPLALLIRVTLGFVPVPRLLEIRTRIRPFAVVRDRQVLGSLVAAADLAAWVARRSGRCLLRSILLFGLVESNIGPVEFFIGIRRDRLTLESHAWIELGGQILCDRPGVVEDFQIVYRSVYS